MSSNHPFRDTAYSQYVNSNLPKLVEQGRGAYTMKELAEMVGLKPTQHFRRRVLNLALVGALLVQPSFSPRGNIEMKFSAPMENNPLEGL